MGIRVLTASASFCPNLVRVSELIVMMAVRFTKWLWVNRISVLSDNVMHSLSKYWRSGIRSLDMRVLSLVIMMALFLLRGIPFLVMVSFGALVFLELTLALVLDRGGRAARSSREWVD